MRFVPTQRETSSVEDRNARRFDAWTDTAEARVLANDVHSSSGLAIWCCASATAR